MGEAGRDLTDAAIIAASLSDPRQFASLFDRHARAVHRYVASRGGEDAVDDLVSETFIAAFRSRSRYDESYDDARPWLLGIATNLLRHHRRAELRRLARLRKAAGSTPEVAADAAEQAVAGVVAAGVHRQVAVALARLDRRHREVLVLVIGNDLTYDEAARALGVPVGTVRSRLARARRRLRELLDASGQYQSDDVMTNPVPADRRYP